MTYAYFLERVINQAVEAARRRYSGPDDGARLSDALKALDACRGKKPERLAALWWQLARKSWARPLQRHTMAVEVDHVADCVAAWQESRGKRPILITSPRGRSGASKAVNDGCLRIRRERPV